MRLWIDLTIVLTLYLLERAPLHQEAISQLHQTQEQEKVAALIHLLEDVL